MIYKEGFLFPDGIHIYRRQEGAGRSREGRQPQGSEQSWEMPTEAWADGKATESTVATLTTAMRQRRTALREEFGNGGGDGDGANNAK